jgi:hypothetical protein
MSALAAGGKYHDFTVYDVPSNLSASTDTRLNLETSIICRLSDAKVTEKDEEWLQKWGVTQEELDLWAFVNIYLCDYYMSADGPIVSIGVNEHRIIFVCDHYPFKFPDVYKIIGPGKMIDIKLWVDKTSYEGKIKFFQTLQSLKVNANWNQSHLLNVIILVASFIKQPSVESVITQPSVSLRFELTYLSILFDIPIGRVIPAIKNS